MTFGSLFAGIGGFDLGLERAGMECKWQVEIDPFCLKVLEKHWPGVKRYGNVKTVGKHNLEPVDLICGGFPCQPFSVAGKRGGREDNRYLWPEMLRVISEVRPTWVIGENVAGIVNMALDQVCSDLEGEGYEVQPFIIPACAVNAPHRRDRVWIVAHAQVNGDRRNTGEISGTDEQQKAKRPEGWLCSPNNANSHADNSMRIGYGEKNKICTGRDSLVSADRHAQNPIGTGTGDKRGEVSNQGRGTGQDRREGLRQGNGEAGTSGVDPADRHAPDTISIHDDDGGHGTSQICRERREEAKVCGCHASDTLFSRPEQGHQGTREPFSEFGGGGWDAPDTEGAGLERGDTEGTGCTGGRDTEYPDSGKRNNQAEPWSEDWYTVATRTCIRGVDAGLPRGVDRVNRLKALGNSVVPQILTIIGRAIKEN